MILTCDHNDDQCKSTKFSLVKMEILWTCCVHFLNVPCRSHQSVVLTDVTGVAFSDFFPHTALNVVERILIFVWTGCAPGEDSLGADTILIYPVLYFIFSFPASTEEQQTRIFYNSAAVRSPLSPYYGRFSDLPSGWLVCPPVLRTNNAKSSFRLSDKINIRLLCDSTPWTRYKIEVYEATL